jgi:DNA end-binding protein Ku
VDSLATEWDPTRYRDTYRETLRAMIQNKVEGREISAPPARRPVKVVNLMDALRRSLKQKKATGPPRKRRAAARRRAA